MVVHLFVAIFSPAHADFTLRKIAEDNSEHFLLKVKNTMRKNCYMDDCLNFLPSETKAVTHFGPLRVLFSRGGFLLTKWISNSREVIEVIAKVEC